MVRVGRALSGFCAITVFYLVALVCVDSRNHVFAELPKLVTVMPVLMALSLISYLLRYLRWHWLLARGGNKTNVVFGYLAYLAGFAFTATPGKVGELLRIRYLGPLGVPPWKVLAAFVWERSFDLTSVLLIAALAINRVDIFILALVFVMVSLAGLVLVALHPAWLTRASAYLRFHRLKRLSRISRVLRDGLSGCRVWATPLDVLVSMVSGLLAWGVTSFSFVGLLNHLGVSIPTFPALAIYPLAMLAGAASMLPGGIGSTEVTIVALLALFDVPLGIATLAAIGIRFSTMWFAVLCGFVAVGTLELLSHRAARRSSIRAGL